MKEISNLFNEICVKKANVSKKGSMEVIESIKEALKENGFRKIEIRTIIEWEGITTLAFQKNKKIKELLVATYRQEGTKLVDLEITVENY